MHALLEAARVCFEVPHRFEIVEGEGGDVMVSRTTRELHQLAGRLGRKDR